MMGQVFYSIRTPAYREQNANLAQQTREVKTMTDTLPENIIHACDNYIIAKQTGRARLDVIRVQQIFRMHCDSKTGTKDTVGVMIKTDYGTTFRFDCTEKQFEYFVKKLIPSFAGFNPEGFSADFGNR